MGICYQDLQALVLFYRIFSRFRLIAIFHRLKQNYNNVRQYSIHNYNYSVYLPGTLKLLQLLMIRKNQNSNCVSRNTSNLSKNLLKSKTYIKKNKECKNKKYMTENSIRRVKKVIFDSIMKFVNNKISVLYNYNIGQGIYIKKLLKNEHFQIKNASAKYNKELLNKTIGEIFSAKITKKFTSFPEEHNKNLINKLTNEKEEKKKEIFKKLFDITLSDCIKHLRGTKIFAELEGLEKIYENEMINLNEEEEYKDKMRQLLANYDKLFGGKKSIRANC